MADEDFELVSHDEIETLRKEVEQIRKNPLGDTASSMTLLDSMNDLTRAIKNLVSIFENTEKELINEYSKDKAGYRLDRVLEQNKEIAHGIIKVAEMVQERPKVHTTSFPPPQREPEAKPDFHEPIMPSRQPQPERFTDSNYPKPMQPPKGDMGLNAPLPPPDFAIPNEQPRKKFGMFGKK